MTELPSLTLNALNQLGYLRYGPRVRLPVLGPKTSHEDRTSLLASLPSLPKELLKVLLIVPKPRHSYWSPLAKPMHQGHWGK